MSDSIHSKLYTTEAAKSKEKVALEKEQDFDWGPRARI